MVAATTAMVALWHYRGFILGTVAREFRARYLNSVLGALWAVFGPLSSVLIFTLVFGRLMRARLPGADDELAYGLFLCAGVFPWGLFNEVVMRSLTIFIEQANLLKKMAFPRGALPAVALLSATVNFAIVFGLLLVVLLLSGRFPGWPILGVLPLLAVQQALALGLGLTLGVLNVFFRDVAHMVGIVFQLWFWFTPIVYPRQILGETTQRLLALNPLAPLVDGYQRIIVAGAWPDWEALATVAAFAALACAVGVAVLRRLAGELVDAL